MPLDGSRSSRTRPSQMDASVRLDASVEVSGLRNVIVRMTLLQTVPDPKQVVW